MINDLSDSDSGDDWDENEETQIISCLFCTQEYNDRSDALKHLEVCHDFSLPNFKIKHALDMYSYIKLINFIRKKNVSAYDLNALNIKIWDSDEYLTPFIPDDAWLMFGKQIFIYLLFVSIIIQLLLIIFNYFHK